MGRAARSRPGELEDNYELPGLGVGTLERDAALSAQPATLAGHHLWFFGEAYDSHGRIDLEAVEASEDSQTSAFRRKLLELVLDHGFGVLRALDGQYVVALWRAKSATLSVVNDRYGTLPLYWSRNTEGFAMSSTVRAVLMAPGVESMPDIQALREAVTFGGYRLGERTNVEHVKMMYGGTELSVCGETVTKKRYWSYAAIEERDSGLGIDELVEQASELWTRAIKRRLPRSGRCGQTLSGGLDSRSILAEAAPLCPEWAAVSYGIPNSDDVQIAKRAAEASGVAWSYHDPYMSEPHWLESRTSFVQQTDGLIDLTDLMHVASVQAQALQLDVHFSGYIGDAVCGPTFTDVENTMDLKSALPFYATRLGMDQVGAERRIEEIVAGLSGAPPRFALFEHKIPQSTNRWVDAWRPWLAVRRPFLDYNLFDFWQGLPVALRREGRLYERWLKHRFPELFRTIPNQKDMVPVLSSPLRRQIVRTVRFAARKVLGTLNVKTHSRGYHDEHRHWSQPGNRRRIEESILRPESVSCDVFGRSIVRAFLTHWFETSLNPTQVIGALYVFETYHRDLASHLRESAIERRGQAPVTMLETAPPRTSRENGPS